ESDRRYWSVKRLLVDDMTLKLNRLGNGGKENRLPPPEPTKATDVNANHGSLKRAHTAPLTPAATPSTERSEFIGSESDASIPDLSESELEDRYMEELYLEDDFDVKYEQQSRHARLEHWNKIKDGDEGKRIKDSLNFSNKMEEVYKRRKYRK